MPVTKTEQATTREFIGRAWKNVVKNEESKYVGVEFINVVLDNATEQLVMNHGSKLQLWPNKKREGKKDADYRVSLIEPEVANAPADAEAMVA